MADFPITNESFLNGGVVRFPVLLSKQVTDCIQGKPDLNHGGSNVDLVVSTSSWTVTKTGTNEILFLHKMPTISFASSGDGTTVDFVGYVAKTEIDRRCYVFECNIGDAQHVLTAIGEAFHLRFEHFSGVHQPDTRSSERPINGVHRNVDMSFSGSPASPPSTLTRRPQPSTSPLTEANHQSLPPRPPPDQYQNEPVVRPAGASSNGFEPPTNFDLLEKERWFHGSLSREKSETLVRSNGDFLVRRSEKTPSQFVLTGMQDGLHKHLLLIDEQGKVRTKDREFNDICHLIQHHRDNSIPITSAESSLMLRTPVVRLVQQTKF